MPVLVPSHCIVSLAAASATCASTWLRLRIFLIAYITDVVAPAVTIPFTVCAKLDRRTMREGGAAHRGAQFLIGRVLRVSIRPHFACGAEEPRVQLSRSATTRPDPSSDA